MERTYHFISGLPRSGSTLLAGILNQNPAYHASMSSPVASLINSFLEQTSANSEFSSFFDAEKRKEMSHNLFHSYYSANPKRVIWDTNRQWTAHMHQLITLFDDFKVICCVRNPAWILDSFECIYRKNPFEYSRMFSAVNRQNVYTRCETLVAGSGIVGSAIAALKEAFYGEFSERLLVVDYDLLAQHPQKTLNLIYQFIDENEYKHNFNAVDYDAGEFDQQLGIPGLHTVKKKVEFKPRRSILPPDLFKKYSEMAFWQDSNGTAANIIVPK